MLSKLSSLIKLVFSRTADTSVPEGRSRDRYRRVGRTALTALAARIVNIATGLATVPITLSYLGTDRYGLWMALTSFVAFLTFTDLGLGIGLQNALAECYGRDDHKSPRSYVSSAMLVMILVFMVLIGVAFFVLPHLPLNALIKTKTEAAGNELLQTAQAVIIAFGVGLPCGLIQRIYNGYQQGYWANMWLLIGRIVGFLGVLVCIWLKLALPWLVMSVMGLPFICLGLGGLSLFAKTTWLRPSIRAVNRSAMRRIFSTGITAVGAQVAYVILHNGPVLIIANRLGTAAVTPFAVTQKLLGVMSILLSTAALPLWPAYGEAAARGDWGWVEKTFRRSIYLTIAIYSPIFLIVSIWGRDIIQVWTQNASAVPKWTLLMGCNVFCLLMAWNTVASMLLNGLDRMLGQAVYGNCFSVLSIITGFWVASTYGASGVIWAIVISGGITRSIAMGLEVVGTIRKKSQAAE